MHINNVIKKPIITEKSIHAGDVADEYLFKVSNSASKGAIKNEVESLFGVNVLDVRTMIMPGKKRRVFRTNRFIKTPKWKKAIVKVKSGQKISLVKESK